MKKREELVKAQTLFQLPIVSYPQLPLVEADIKLLHIIYDVYVAHSWMVQEFSAVHWSKLDIDALQKASDDFDKRVKRMPKDVKEIGEIPAFNKLEQLVNDFKNSVPLIQSLKHPAIKSVHWKSLQDLWQKDNTDLSVW